jgi:hypothetical protein
MGKRQVIEDLDEQLLVLREKVEILEREKAALKKDIVGLQENAVVLQADNAVLAKKAASITPERQKAIAEELEKRVRAILSRAICKEKEIISRVNEEAIAEKAARRDQISAALQALSEQNALMSEEIHRQELGLMTALRKTADTILSGETDAEDFQLFFADQLVSAIKKPAGVVPQPLSFGAIVLQDLAEFQSLGQYGFRNNVIVTSVTLPEGVQALPESFFYGCRNLRSVSLPQSMSVIGAHAFFGCTSLQSVALPRELESIGEYAFSGCDALEHIRIPGGVKTIGTAAFRNCSNLMQVETAPDGCLRTIGSHAFQNCIALKSFSLPSGITVLPTSLFYGCLSLVDMDVPQGVIKMDSTVFSGCEQLFKVSFHNPELLLMPGATEGLEKATLTLSGKVFPWHTVEVPMKLKDLAKGTWGLKEPEIVKEAMDVISAAFAQSEITIST